MSFWVTFRIALKALRRNKMRAGLTVLGLVIGIAAVTTMVSIGESAGKLVQQQFDALGTNVIIVSPKGRRRRGLQSGSAVTLTAEDSNALPQECDSVIAATPIVGTAGQVIYGNANWSPRELFGVGPEYPTVRNWECSQGGFFTDREVKSASKVCVIGWKIVAELFQTTNPIGEKIRIRKIPFEVIGVLEKKGANMVGQDQDDVILVPYSTVQKRLQGSSFRHIHAIMASARSVTTMASAQEDIKQLLNERHKIGIGETSDFEVQNTTEIANVLGTITGTLTALLAAIAGISLLVGGVGIMNIMLVSVTERTREIGIRMAVGARGRDILRQFLVESVVLSCIGGLIGLALGISASVGATVLINSVSSGSDWPIVISMPAAVVAIFFSTTVGVFFGFYPARKASRLDPIEALRYE